MKTNPSVKPLLAGIGGVSLLIYVLACATSFSPDDRQVLYPTFDPQSGATAVAVYDRNTSRSEILFSTAEAEAVTNPAPVPLRAEWMPDGKHILIARAEKHDGLELLVLPRGLKEPVRHFQVAGLKESAASLAFPFAIAGQQLFINADDKRPWLRVNLLTGETLTGDTNSEPFCILPSLDGQSLTAVRDSQNGKLTEFGTFDPQALKFNRLGQMGTNLCNGTVPAFNPADGRAMSFVQNGEQLVLQVVRNGKPEFARPLAHGGDKLQPGPFLALSPDGKAALTAYCAENQAATNCEYGLLEIPLGDAPLRFTPLFHTARHKDEDLIYAQPSLSHDGKTWAIGTALLYQQNDSLQPEDCALFLVDLSKSSRPVKKISIPVSAERQSFK